MKKHFYYAIALLLLLTVSCVSEKIETQENNVNYIPEKVWVYDGDNTVLKGVIQELKNGTHRASLERRLLKNEVLWQNAEFLVIEDKKRILVPFLSIDKENIIGFFALYRDSKGNIQYDMTVRSDVFNKNVKLPFWNSNIWVGYFKAYDRTILGKKNGNPGVMRKAIPKEELKAMTSRLVCDYMPYESCVTVGGGGGDCDGGTGEGWSDCGGGGGGSYTVCTIYYTPYCFDVPDDPNPNPNPEPEPENPEPEDPGTGGEIAEIPPSCKAFGYSNVASNWQAAATKNIVALIGYYDLSTGEYNTASVLFPQPIYFEIPINSPANGGYISPGRAGELTALAVESAISRAKYYFLSTNASSSQVQAKLWEYIRDEMTNGTHIIGGKASFTPPLGFNGEIKDFKAYWFIPDNCD